MQRHPIFPLSGPLRANVPGLLSSRSSDGVSGHKPHRRQRLPLRRLSESHDPPPAELETMAIRDRAGMEVARRVFYSDGAEKGAARRRRWTRCHPPRRLERPPGPSMRRTGASPCRRRKAGRARGRDHVSRQMLKRVPIMVALTVLIASAATAERLRTDESKALVPLDEIIPGGPPPDGIPAIDRPAFIAARQAAWLVPQEPVLALEINGDARAYPLQILMWHEIVNDTVGGKPVVVTFCPLRNSGIAFDRVVGDVTLDFGTSGKVYKSDLVMYDRQSHSLWAQMEGRALVGQRAGTRLALVPANTIAFADWKAAHPDGKVLSRETGHQRQYGANPYGSYDQPELRPFLFNGRPDTRRPPKERVVGVKIGETAKAYPWPILAERRVLHDAIDREALVIFFQPGALSALDDARIERSRAVGATAVYSRMLDGKSLTFEANEGGFRDRETGTTWNLLGRGVKGPLAGRRLRAIPHVDAFWFAWAAFHPTTILGTAP
ncbi:MAG: DUF3179 domain-containing protein [Candidatus Rokubacteria bacterium]|nr:DUF3179 domain-containing protein [Candidatus Rokubacteria bacterium]